MSAGPVGPAAQPTLEQFVAECRAFFEQRYERRAATTQFQWGHGSDNVALFDEDSVSDVDAEDPHVDEIASVRRWRRELADAGLAWITGPKEFGGRGLPASYQRAFDAVAREYLVPGNRKLMVSLGMVAPTIHAHASRGALDRYLSSLYDGSVIGCQLFSEPGAGSDLASVATRAERDDEGWVITGQKLWTSGAHFSDIGIALCRTGSGGAARHRDLTMFIVDMRSPGVTVRPLRQMTGGAAFNEVFLDGVVVPDADRLGEVGDGWRVALTTLSSERSAVGGDGFGGSGLLSRHRYIELAQAFGLDGDPIVRQSLADLTMHLQVAKWNAQRAADARRSGQIPGPEGSLGKLTLTANYQRISHFVGTIVGPRLIADSGDWGTYAWAEFVLGVPGMRVGGGTDEVQRNIIAERVLGMPRSDR